MTEHGDPLLGGRLLDLETHNPTLREEYGAALHDHLDRQLSGGLRAKYVVVGLAGLAGCLVCGSLAVTEPASLPAAVRGLLTLLAFFGLGWTLLAAWVLARGRGGFITHRIMAARMAFGFTLASVIALSVTSSLTGRSAVGMPMVASGLAMLILAAVLLIDARIERSESLIREQILRVESRLTVLTEFVERPRGGRDDER
jgi:hypothetical protein